MGGFLEPGHQKALVDCICSSGAAGAHMELSPNRKPIAIMPGPVAPIFPISPRGTPHIEKHLFASEHGRKASCPIPAEVPRRTGTLELDLECRVLVLVLEWLGELHGYRSLAHALSHATFRKDRGVACASHAC